MSDPSPTSAADVVRARGLRGFLARHPVALGAAVVALLVLGTVEERTFGTVTDEQVMLSTSLAMARFGEIGIPRGAAIALERAGGDAVAPYGLAWPALLAPFMRAAGPFERIFGGGSSQSLLVLLPTVLVILASALAGLLARELGAGPIGQVIAVLATGIGSPLWAYASTAYTEPLQAALFVGAVLLAARGARAGTSRATLVVAAAAGALAALAVLTKSVNAAVAPILLAPLVLDRIAAAPLHARERMRRIVAAAAGAAPVLAAWLVGEVARFGRPFAGYSGQHFSHPILDGLWRLVLGLNEGLLVFFPALVLAVVGVAVLARGTAVAIGATSLVLLALYSAWWAWDGSSGWGPRLLVPLVPLLAAAAGVATARGPRARLLGAALVLAGACVNVIGVLESDTATVFFLDHVHGPATVPEEQVSWYPDGLAATAPAGERRISFSMAAARDARFSPLRVASGLLGHRMAAPTADVPRFPSTPGQLSGVLATYLTEPFSWPHWGAALACPASERRLRFHGAWRDASIDQTLRALDTGRPDRALELAREQWEIAKEPLCAVLAAECLRELGRRDELGAFLRSLPPEALAPAEMDVVLALTARDAGHDDLARTALANAASALDRPAIRQALERPPSEWPRTYRDLTR